MKDDRLFPSRCTEVIRQYNRLQEEEAVPKPSEPCWPERDDAMVVSETCSLEEQCKGEKWERTNSTRGLGRVKVRGRSRVPKPVSLMKHTRE